MQDQKHLDVVIEDKTTAVVQTVRLDRFRFGAWNDILVHINDKTFKIVPCTPPAELSHVHTPCPSGQRCSPADYGFPADVDIGTTNSDYKHVDAILDLYTPGNNVRAHTGIRQKSLLARAMFRCAPNYIINRERQRIIDKCLPHPPIVYFITQAFDICSSTNQPDKIFDLIDLVGMAWALGITELTILFSSLLYPFLFMGGHNCPPFPLFELLARKRPLTRSEGIYIERIIQPTLQKGMSYLLKNFSSDYYNDEINLVKPITFIAGLVGCFAWAGEAIQGAEKEGVDTNNDTALMAHFKQNFLEYEPSRQWAVERINETQRSVVGMLATQQLARNVPAHPATIVAMEHIISKLHTPWLLYRLDEAATAEDIMPLFSWYCHFARTITLPVYKQSNNIKRRTP